MSSLTLDDLGRGGHPALLFETVSGSRAYGTATADSDEDLRGVYALPASDYLSLSAPAVQLADARNDVVYLSLRRTIELLAAGNPSVIELLYMPVDCVRHQTPIWQQLVDVRSLFVTRRCAEAHIGYAQTQIKKARGQNKWINQPKPEHAPRKEDFCHVIRADRLSPGSTPPCRPQALRESGIDLRKCHAARVDHAPGIYRLYAATSNALGVFRDDQLCIESITLEQESTGFLGLLIYNEQGWRQASVDHSNYWTWRRERNEARWRQQERGELDYDAKNLMHTLRLLRSGESILRHHRPLVRFEGEALSHLMAIRQGKFSYDEVLQHAMEILQRCEQLKDSCDLPETVCPEQANQLLHALTRAWEGQQ